MFDFTRKLTIEVLEELAEKLINLSDTIGFKVSSRGWCYLMEQAGEIDKSQFDKVDGAINRARKMGILPVDFVAEESSRAFSCVELPDYGSIEDLLTTRLERVINGHIFYTPDWWEGEQYYIQVLVEKIDLKTLFEPICIDYHIPIANAKGWSSILQRAEYARRFKEAEERGLIPVLLYCGDHDADGLRISDTLRKNLEQVNEVFWGDGETGYDLQNLEIKRFGLNYDFIIENNYTWIDNLITGSGKNLASSSHRNFNFDYVQNYIAEFGIRKCEANAIVTTPTEGRNLFINEIEEILGDDALSRFSDKKESIKNQYVNILDESGLLNPILDFLSK